MDGRCIGGFIHKPFSNQVLTEMTESSYHDCNETMTNDYILCSKTLWSWRKQRGSLLSHVHLMDEVELNNRTYHDHEGLRSDHHQQIIILSSSTIKLVTSSVVAI